jgi:hypothetical protein
VSVQFISRASWFAGTPTSNSGAARPKLATPVPTMTRHYTGSPVSRKASEWPCKEWMPWFQSVALASGKSYEYNYVIPPRADGTAQIWEYAGTYQAAHSAGENATSVGVLFAIGVNNHPSYQSYDPTRPTQWEPLTPPMIEAYRYLRDEILARQGIIHPMYVNEIEHRHMPGAATACPGIEVIDHARELSAPYVTPAPTPPPTTPEDLPMTFLWKPAGFKNVFLVDGGGAVHASPELLEHCKKMLVPTVPDAGHAQMLKSVLTLAGCALSDLVKE